MLRNGDGLDFLVLILWDRVVVEGEPDAGVPQLLTLVGWPDRSADVHMSEDLTRYEQGVVLEADRYRWHVTETFQNDRVQALLMFGEEEIQVRFDVDYDGGCGGVNIELHLYLGEVVLQSPQVLHNRPQG